MKKIFTFLAMITIAMTTFTSCDQDAWDRHDARTLDGTWTGYIDVYYADRWGWTGDSYRTTFRFVQENAYGGWGEEADYNLTYGDSFYSEFMWEVVNSTIRITYPSRSGLAPIRIYNYRLYDDFFEGYIDDGTSKDIHFQLYYDGNYNWGRWSNSYYASRRGASTATEINEMGGERGTNFYATGRFAERLNSLNSEAVNK